MLMLMLTLFVLVIMMLIMIMIFSSINDCVREVHTTTKKNTHAALACAFAMVMALLAAVMD